MIIAGFGAAPGQTPAKSADVEALQRALNALAITTGNTSFQVTVDGLIGPMTTAAALSAIGVVANYITNNNVVRVALVGLPIYYATNPTSVQNTLKQYASELSKAILGYIAAKVATGTVPPAPPSTSTTLPGGGLVWNATSISPSQNPSPDAAPSKTVYAYDTKKAVFRIATPIGVAAPTPAPTHVEVGTSATAPTNATQVPLPIYLILIGQTPWYKTWWGMAMIGVGSVGVIAGTYYFVTRDKNSMPRLTSGGM